MPHISEIFEMVDQEPKRSKKIEILQQHKSPQLETILKYTYDKRLQFRISNFPEYQPDPSPADTAYANLTRQSSKLHHFLDDKANPLTPTKVNVLMIQLCESLSSQEADIVYNMVVHRRQLAKGMTLKLVQEAFPDLIDA